MRCRSLPPVKVKVFLYSPISSPLDRSKCFTLFALPGRPVHSDTNSASPGSILAMLQLRTKTKSLQFPPLTIARYSFIQLIQLERQWRERKFPIFETIAKGDSNPGALDCESGILPRSSDSLWLRHHSPAGLSRAHHSTAKTALLSKDLNSFFVQRACILRGYVMHET